MPEGEVITLPINLGTTPKHLNLMVDFFVVKIPSTYNMILGHPCIKMAKTALSTYHLMMKFLIEIDIREARGNQIVTIRGKVKKAFIVSLENLAEQKESKVELAKGG